MPTINKEQAVELIKKEFIGYEKGVKFYGTEVSEDDNYIFIASHVCPVGYTNYLHRYFLLSIYKHLFDKIIYSDSNVIGKNSLMSPKDAKERTKAYLLHLHGKIVDTTESRTLGVLKETVIIESEMPKERKV